MSITYTWSLTSMKTKDVDGKPDAVVQTYWKKIGTDADGITGEFAGATPFTPDPTDEDGPFVPFEELTEEIVLDWIKSVVIGDYEEHVNRQIQQQIDAKKSPVKEVTFPWATPTITP